jgi:serine/threonine kinase PknH
MGRRELPVTGTGPVEQFAQALRRLRVAAGTPSYRVLARKAGYSPSALSSAANGVALPSLNLALAYAGACGGDLAEWEKLWRAAAGSTANEPVFEPLAADDPELVGPYRLRARIGSGGTGRVYLSYTDSGRALAVTVVRSELAEDAEFRLRFERAVAAARQVHGTFTAPVVDADVRATRPWLAEAYVPGPSLSEAVTAHGPLPARSLWLLTAGIGEALQTGQRARLVYRDVTPAKVLLAADGPRLLGLPQFVAPDHPADVFMLGFLTLYAATGEADADTAAVPGELRELVAACVARDPARRPRLGDVIRECRRQGGIGSQRGWLPSAHTAEIRRRAAAVA